MTQLQKVIKYLAIAFAIVLIIGIITGILGAVASLSYIYDNDAKEINGEFVSDGTAKSLDIEIGAAELEIIKGDVFKAEYNSEYIICRQSRDELTIKVREGGLFSNGKGNRVIVYVPEDFVFEKAHVEAGAGKVRIDSLSSESLELEIGAGEMTVETLNAARRADIEIGAGEMTIKGGSLANLDLELGMGQLNLTSALTGSSKLDFGVGEANLHLIGKAEDYTIKSDKGIGSAIIDGRNMHDNETYGSGESRILIDGGIGSIVVDYAEAE